MARKTTITRTYQSRLDVDCPSNLIEKTYDVYNRGADFFLSFVTRLLGGYCADGTVESTIHSLPFWFTLQHNNGSNLEFAVCANEIPSLHKKYWESQTNSTLPVTPLLEHFYATVGVDSQRKDSIWIDQRKRYYKGSSYQPDSATIALFVNAISSEENTNQFCSKLISKWWGNGEESDWAKIYSIYNRISSFIKTYVQIDANIFRETLCRILNINVCSSETFEDISKKAMGGKIGRTDAVVSLTCKLYKETNIIGEDLLNIYKNIVAKGADKALSEANSKPQAWFNLLLHDFEQQVKFKFRNKRDNTFEVSEMFALAMQRYCSWHSWFHLQMQERVDRYSNFNNANINFKANSAIIDSIEKLRKPGQSYFSMEQFRGIRRFLGIYKDNFNKNDVANTLKSYCEDSNYRGNLGDSSIFMNLIDIICKNNIKPYDVETSIEQFLDLQQTAASYYLLNSPCLRPIDKTSAIDPWFGKSKGYFNVKLNEFPNTESFNLTLGLFDGSQFVRTQIKVNGKRFAKEIYNTTGIVASRDNNQIRKYIKADDDSFIEIFNEKNEDKLSCQIKPVNGNWYFNIKVELNPLLLNRKELTSKYMEKGTSLLGVDLGWNHAAAFCHYVTDPNGDVVVINEKQKSHKLNLRVVDIGLLKEKQTYNNGKKIFCRLKNKMRAASSYEIGLWERLVSLLGWNKTIKQDTMSVNNDIVFFTYKLARRKTVGIVDIIQEVYLHIKNSHIGGLSLAKISILMKLRDAYNAVIKNLEFVLQPVNPVLYKQRDSLVTRMNNVRRERSRIIANCIVKKALDTNSLLVALEKLSSQGNVNNNSNFNKRINDWCASRIAKLVEQAGEEYGFVVKLVYPEYTSLTDFVTNDVKARFNIINVNDIKPYIEKDLKKCLASPTNNKEQIVSVCLRAKMETHKLDLTFENLVIMLRKEAINGRVYVPQIGRGEIYYSHTMGWSHSDLTAAAFIGRKGLMFFLGWLREKEGDESKELAENGEKPKQNKHKPKSLDHVALSRGARALAAIPWGVDKEVNNEDKIKNE